MATDGVSEPLSPSLYAGSSGGFELYWFYPGVHQISAGNIDSLPQSLGALTTDPGKYAVMNRFPLDPPALINSVSTYIADIPGSQYMPITLTLSIKPQDTCFDILWSQRIALDPSICGFGSVITTDSIRLKIDDYDVWAGLEWPEDTAYMPYVGLNNTNPRPEQYVWNMSASNCTLTPCQFEFMVGMDNLGWTSSSDRQSTSYEDLEGMMFEVFYSPDTVDFIDLAEVVDTAYIDSMFSAIEIEKSGYIAVKANDGSVSAFTDFVYIDMEQKPHLVVDPPLFEMPYNDKRGPEYFGFDIVNTDSAAVNIRLFCDTLLLCLDRDSMTIEPGQRAAVDFYLVANDSADSVICSTIRIVDRVRKYPMLYHLRFIKSGLTDVEQPAAQENAVFSVGPACPNPFNPEVGFRLEGFAGKSVIFEVFNILGQCIYAEELNVSGNCFHKWSIGQKEGLESPSGVYFFKFSDGPRSHIRRAVLIK